ncbi:MAG: HD domain-containing phosphohydrolase [Chromatiaceae bacterium]
MNERAKILIVDDDERARRLLESLLQQDFQIFQAEDGMQALKMAAEIQPDLILLDQMMPGMTGYEATLKLKEDPLTKSIPIIVVSALDDRESRLRGLDAGAEEYLYKPVDRIDLKIRVRNLLRLKEFSDFLKNHNLILEEEVRARTSALQTSFIESIFTLMRAAEYRDDQTGAHVRRVSHYTRLLAEQLGMPGEFCDQIFYASPMHDIGKIGIPDHILLKPGNFEPAEREIMKGHVLIGSDILAGNSSPYFQMGHDIALGHHERWDGGGYPSGLKGEATPLPARIMQLVDVYDALRSKRPYKPAFTHDKSLHIICKGDGRTAPSHFDPAVLAALIKRARDCEAIFAQPEPREAW